VGVPFHSTLNPQLFDAQIRYVKKHYRVVPIAQLCSELACGRDVSPTLAITFDDGYRDLYLYAFPVLKKYGIPATIYLIGRCVETGEAHWYDRIFASIATYSKAFLEVETDSIRRLPLATPEMRLSAAWEIVCYLRSVPDAARQQWCFEFDQRMSPPLDLLEKRMLDWSQIKTMHGAGVSFGAHTMNHPAISRLEPAAYDLELATCKSALERGLGVPVDDFAYPFGKLADGNDTARQFLERTGYRSAVTTIPGFNSFGDNPHMLRRLQINSDCSLPSFAFNLTRMFVEAPEEYAVAQDPAAVRSESRGLLF
jgi:peptidoglycan/xylan/chitin deacetylase (PgdA/CDA1 family)